MSYAQTANRANPVAMLGALGIPGAFGAILVIGLAVKVAVPDKPENPDTFFTDPDVVIPPPPPKDPVEPVENVEDVISVITPPTAPDTAIDLSDTSPITTLPEPDIFVIEPIETLPSGGGTNIIPEPKPVLPDPIAASPRNKPGRWVTDSDYRSNWIRQEMSGVAGFAVTIDTKGRVSDCTITRSTGHAALDQATCRLIQKRARFEPAKDSYGNPIAGSYRNSVNWRLPR